MDTQTLRVFSANYVAESDINLEDKLDLLGFIKIAERDELLTLLSFGEITEVTTENIKVISEFEDDIDRIILDEGVKDIHDKYDALNKKGIKQAFRKIRGIGKKAEVTKKGSRAKTAVVGGVAIAAAAIAAKKLLKRRKCKKLAGGDADKYKSCMA